MATTKKKLPPRTLEEALVRLSSAREAGRKYRDQATELEKSVAGLLTKLREAHDTIKATEAERDEALDSLGALQIEVECLNERLAASVGGDLQTQKFEALQAIAAARDEALAMLDEARNGLLDTISGAVADDDSDDLDDEEDEEEDESSIEDDEEEDDEEGIAIADVVGDGEVTSEAADAAEADLPPVIHAATVVDASDSFGPQIVNLVNACAKNQGDAWLEKLFPFIEQAQDNPRILVREVVQLLSDNEDTQENLQAAVNELSPSDFKAVVRAILGANDNALGSMLTVSEQG